MKIHLPPFVPGGRIAAPPSKSAMQRACGAALLCKGISVIKSPGRSDDDLAALDIIQRLGATIDDRGDEIEVTSQGVRPVTKEIQAGESGLSLRMFASIAALSEEPILFTGKGSLTRRPMHFFENVFPRLGVKITSDAGHLPLQIQGPLKPTNIRIDGSLSSQYLTGLLMAYSAADAKDLTIEVTDLASRPYIDLTLTVMRKFGLPMPINEGYEKFVYADTPNMPSALRSYRVEGDWSGGAFLLVALALGGGGEVENLDAESTQADVVVLQALRAAGVAINVQDGFISIAGGKLQPFEFDAEQCPDLFPPLAALACGAVGVSVLQGTHRLTHKESNRAVTLQQQLGALGVQVDLKGNEMHIMGTGRVSGGAVDSCHDHRIAMACGVLTAIADAPIEIVGADAVGKSYPDFWNHLQMLGARPAGAQTRV